MMSVRPKRSTQGNIPKRFHKKVEDTTTSRSKRKTPPAPPMTFPVLHNPVKQKRRKTALGTPAISPASEVTPASTPAVDPLAIAPPPESLTEADRLAIAKAVKQKEKQSKAAAKKAEEEAANKTKALIHQRKVMAASVMNYDVRTESTDPERKSFINVERPAVSNGEYVQVSHNPVENEVSGWGGIGWTQNVRGYGAATFCDVKLNELGGGHLLTSITIDRITIIPFIPPNPPPRQRKQATMYSPSPQKSPVEGTPEFANIGEILQSGFSKSMSDGWRRRQVRLKNEATSQLNMPEWYQFSADIMN